MRDELLLKPHWDYVDICMYVGCQKSKAYQIMHIVRKKFNGSIRHESSYVKRDSVLEYLETSIERETYIKDLIERREQ